METPVAIFWDLSSRPSLPFHLLTTSLKTYAYSLGAPILSFRAYSGGFSEQLPETQAAVRDSLLEAGAGLTTYKYAEPINIERLLLVDIFSILLDAAPQPITIVAAVPNPSAFAYASGGLAARGIKLILVADGVQVSAPVVSWWEVVSPDSPPKTSLVNFATPENARKALQKFSLESLFQSYQSDGLETPTPLAIIPSVQVERATPTVVRLSPNPAGFTRGFLGYSQSEDDQDDDEAPVETQNVESPPPRYHSEQAGSSYLSRSWVDDDDANAKSFDHNQRNRSLPSISESWLEASLDLETASTPTPPDVAFVGLDEGSLSPSTPVGSGRAIQGDFVEQASPTVQAATQRQQKLSLTTSDDDTCDPELDAWPTPSKASTIISPKLSSSSQSQSTTTPRPASFAAAAASRASTAKASTTSLSAAGVFLPSSISSVSAFQLKSSLRAFQPLVDAIRSFGGNNGGRIERGLVGTWIVRELGKGFYASVECENFGQYSKNAERAGIVVMGMMGESSGWIALKENGSSRRRR
ncbi:hypothetical protein P7C70_g6935, partial [Phenoliferia sp. Uapishka_3]